MTQAHTSLTIDTTRPAAMLNDGAASVARRRFLGLFTAGATSLALQACGGGGGGSSVSSSTAVAVTPPTTSGSTPATPPSPTTSTSTSGSTSAAAMAWGMVPTISFTQGVVGSISVAQWLQGVDASAVAITLNAAALPAGVTFNAATKTLDYDGIGAVGSTDGHVLTATGA